jgi:splicing factor U2AF subunit
MRQHVLQPAHISAALLLLRRVQVVIPRPSKAGPAADPPGVGLVFLQYEDARSTEKARLALNGRMFGDRPVEASIFDQAQFDAQQYS